MFTCLQFPNGGYKIWVSLFMVFSLTGIAVGPIKVSYLCSRVRAAFPKKLKLGPVVFILEQN